MNKLLAFFLVMMIGFGWFVGIMAGGGGTVTTDLSDNVTSSDTTLPVLTTTDFYYEDYVVIGSEKIYYTTLNGTAFLGCTRGYGDTTAEAHPSGARVYTATTAAMNYALGFNLVAVQDALGWAAFLALPVMFIVRTLPQIIRSGTNLLTGNLATLMWFYYALVGAFIITLAWTLIGSRRVV